MSEKIRIRGISYHSNRNPRMSDHSAPSVNSWLEDELNHQHFYDRPAPSRPAPDWQELDTSWKQVFVGDRSPTNGTTVTIEQLPEPKALPPVTPPAVAMGPDDQAVPLRGPALKIAENMAASLIMPTATSLRVLSRCRRSRWRSRRTLPNSWRPTTISSCVLAAISSPSRILKAPRFRSPTRAL